MFTIDIILAVLKKVFGSVFSFLQEYKYTILVGIIIGFLYIRGNNYKQDLESEATAHAKTVLEHNQQINNIRLANERALRVAQEESASKYKELAEQTSSIQKEYLQREKDINATITKLNSSNNSLQQTISNYTKRNSNSNESVLSDSTSTDRLSITGELLGECIERKQYYAHEADKLNNSVLTLQQWGDMIIESNKGDEDE